MTREGVYEGHLEPSPWNLLVECLEAWFKRFSLAFLQPNRLAMGGILMISLRDTGCSWLGGLAVTRSIMRGLNLDRLISYY